MQWESEDEEDDDDYWLAKPDYGLSNAGNLLLFAIILCSQLLYNDVCGYNTCLLDYVLGLRKMCRETGKQARINDSVVQRYRTSIIAYVVE